MKTESIANAKHASSKKTAVTFLRRMPLWQRLISAIMAVLLVFLLWPADAAKTLTAWATDAEASVTTEEATPEAEPESEDPGTGGEEADDPQVDPVPDPEPEPEVDPAVDPQEEGGEEATSEYSENAEFDENAIYLDSNAPVNGVGELCGPFEWNFSAYANNARSFSVANSETDIKQYPYLDTNKCANLTFVGPFGNNNNMLDGGATAVTSDGFVMDRYHRLDGSTNKNTDGNILSNYIIFKPNSDLESITLSVEAVQTLIYNYYIVSGNYHPYIGFIEVDNPGEVHSSTEADYEQAITSSSSWTNVTWKGVNNKGLKSDKSYIIYFKPNQEVDSGYANYGGVKINNIKAVPGKGNVEVNITNTADDVLDFYLCDYPDTTSQLQYHIAEQYTISTERLNDASFTFENIAATTYNRWVLKSQRTGIQVVGSSFDLMAGDTKQIPISVPYPYLRGQVTNQYRHNTIDSVQVTYETTNGEPLELELTDLNIEPNSSKEIIIPVITNSGVLTIKPQDQGLENATIYEKYCDVAISSQTTQLIVDFGTYYVSEGKIETSVNITIKELEYEKLDTEEQSSEGDVEVYRLISTTSGGYYQKNVLHNSGDPDTYTVLESDLIRVVSKPYGLWFKDKATGEYINLNKYKPSSYSDLQLQLQIPKYSWNTVTTENASKEYSCTAEFEAVDPVSLEKIPLEKTIYTTGSEETPDGYIDREVIERETTTTKGREKLIAKFAAVQYFKEQSAEYDIDIASKIHVCDHGTFNTPLKGEYNKLPTDGSKTYYLDGDVYVSDMATISKGTTINLCLNGYAIYWKPSNILEDFSTPNPKPKTTTKTFYDNQGTLNICDCHKDDPNCRHYFTVASDGTWVWTNDPPSANAKYVDGGIITGAEKSAIFNEGTLKCTDVNFVGNKNSYNSNSFGEGSGGGAIRSGTTNDSYSPDLWLNSCTFKGNISQGAGGAVLVGVSNTDGNAGQAHINNCYFSNNALVGETSSTSGFNHPWGGGALATFSLSDTNPVVYIDDSEFYENTSKFRAGAIMLFHGTKCLMSNTTIQHNKSGLYYETGKSTSYNYAGGVCVYTGYGDEVKHNTYLYLSGKINCTENYSETRENGNIVTYEDNVGLQVQDNNIRGYIYLQQNSLLDPSSVIGVNYIDNHNLDISQGYGNCYVPQSERQDPIVKYFVLDEVADRLSYALLIDMSSYEMWIVEHTHKLTYDNATSIKFDDDYDLVGNYGIQQMPQKDILKVKCSAGTSTVSGHTFSKCKYEQNECAMYIHSEDNKTAILGEYIPYDGNPHGVVVDNKNEFEGIIDEKPIDYDAITNPSGIIYYNDDKKTYEYQAPTEPGFYLGVVRYYDVQIRNGAKVVDTSTIHMAVSNYFEIRGPELTVNVGDIEKTYDRTTEAQVTDCWIADEGKVVQGDDVRVVIKYGYANAKAYCDSPYVGKHNIVSMDASMFELVGLDAYKYSLGNVVGTVNINPCPANYHHGDFVLFENSPSINLSSLIGIPEEIANRGVVAYTTKQSNVGTISGDIYTRNTDAAIQALFPSPIVPSTIYEGMYEAPVVLNVSNVTPVDINGDGINEYIGPSSSVMPPHINGHLILNPENFYTASFELNEPSLGKLVDDKGDDISEWQIFSGNGSNTILATVEKDYSACPYALKVADQKGNVKYIRYSINEPNNYVYQKWSYKKASDTDWTDISEYPIDINENVEFKCNIIPKTTPDLLWEVTPYKDASYVVQKAGEELKFKVNIKNVGSTAVSFNASFAGQLLHVEPKVLEYGDYFFDNPVEVTCKVDTTSFVYNIVNIAGHAEVHAPSDLGPFSWGSYEEDWSMQYDTAPLNTGLQVDVTPDPTDVTITAETTIKYTVTITNTGNVGLVNLTLSSELLGITGMSVKAALAPDDSYTLTGVPQLTLSNINETMIVNNEIKTDILIRSLRADSSSTTTIPVDASGYGLTTIHKKTVEFPTAIPGLTYNGTQLTGVNYNSDGLYVDTNVSNTDAGTYTCNFYLKPWYTWTDSTYTAAYYSVTYTIAPKALTAIISGDAFQDEYDGKTHSYDFHNIITGYVEGESEDAKIQEAWVTTNGSDAATYDLGKVTLSYTDVPNYVLTVQSANVVITPKTFSTSTIGIDTTNKIYNGKSQTTDYSIWDITIDETPTLLTVNKDFTIVSGDSGIDAGQYTLVIKGSGNYATSELSAHDPWLMEKSKLTITLTGKSDSKVYTGEPQTLTGASVTYTSNPQSLEPAVIGEITPNPTTIEATGTDVGTYCMFDEKTFSLSDASKKNIDATFIINAGYLTITKKSIEDGDVTVNGSESLPFNGNEQDCGISVTYNGKTLTLGTDYSVVDNKFKNVGSYKAKITALGNNFTGSKDFDWAIIVKDMPITHDPFNKEYDATFLTDTFNFKPFDTASTDEFKVTVQTSSDTFGQYYGSATVDPYLIVNVSPANETTDLENYKLSWDTLSASISKKALRVVPQSRSFEYDGFEHSLVSNEVKYLKPGSTEDGLLTNHYVDVNAGDVTWSENNKATNYTEVPIVVSVNNIKITSATIYDGTKKDVTENYKIDYATTANLEITKLKMTIDVVGLNAGLDDSERIFYDGKEHSITGYKAAEKRTGTGATQTGKFDIKYLTPISDNCSVTATTPGEYKLQYNGRELTAADFTYTDTNIAATINYDPGVLKISKNVVTITVNESKNMDGNKFVHKIITDKSSDLCEVEGLAPNEGFSTSEDSTLTTNDVVEGCYDKEGTTGFSFTADLKWDKPEYASHYELSYFVKLTIKTQLVVTITGHRSNDSNVIYYDGQTHTIDGYESSGSKDTFDEKYLHMKPASVGKDSVSGINAGKYDMGLTANDFYYDDPSELNPEIVVVDGYLIIKQKELKDEMLEDVKPLEMEYNGQTQGPTFTVKNGASVLLTGRDFYVDDGTGVDAGTYKAVIHGQGNYTGQIKPVQWKITKATITFEITGNSDVRQYNGQEHTVSGYTYKVDKLAPFIKDENLKLESDKGTITKIAAGEYKMNLEAANFSYVNDDNIIPIFKVKDGSLTIQKRKLSDANVYLDPDTYVYDGAQHEPTVIIKDLGSDEPLPLKLFNISGETIGKNAGTYKIKVDAYTDDSNYDGVVELPWTIEKVYMEINISGTSKTDQYNGKQQSVEGFTAEKVSDTGFFDSSKITGGKALAEGTSVGLYYMHLIASDFKYNDDNQFVKFNIAHDGCLEITPIDINTFDVSVNPSYFVYDGTYKEPNISATSTAGDFVLDKDYVKEGAKAKNVGDYQLKITGIGNYTGVREFDWTIGKADVNVEIIGNTATQPFDGTLKTVSGYTARETTTTGLIDKGIVKVIPDSNSCVVQGTDVGNYPMNLFNKQFDTDNNNVNFTYSIQDGSLVISSIDIASCEISAAGKTYNGKEQNAELRVEYKGLYLTEGEDYTLSGDASEINADTYTVTVTGKGNFIGTKDVNWTISPAPVDVHISANSKTYTYDAAQHSVSGFVASADVDFFNPSSVTYSGSVPAVTGTNAGVYESSEYASFVCSDTNIKARFIIDQAKAKLVINPAELTVSARGVKFEDGSALQVTNPTVTGWVGGETATVTVQTNSSTWGIYNQYDPVRSGCFSSTFTPDITNNYSVTYDVELNIQKVPEAGENVIAIYGNSATYTYDGTEKTLDGKVISDFKVATNISDYDPNKLSLNRQVVVKATNAGSYKLGLTDENFSYSGEVENLTILYYDGALTITPKQITSEMITEFAPTTFMYNTSEQGPSITVKDGEKVLNTDNYDVENGSAVDAGVYNAIIKGKGNYTGEVTGFSWVINKVNVVVNVNDYKEYDDDVFKYTLYPNEMVGKLKDDMIECEFKTDSAVPGIYTVGGSTGHSITYKYTGDSVDNYNFTTNVKLVINKRVINVTPTSKTYSYDGKEHKLLDNEIDFDNLKNTHYIGEITWNDSNSLTSVGTNKNVAVQNLKIYKSGLVPLDITDYYSFNFNTATLTVEPGSIAIQVNGNSANYPYDGQSHKVTGYEAWEVPASVGAGITGTFDKNKLVALNECIAVGVEPGTYKMNQSKDNFVYEDRNFDTVNITYEDGSMTITKNSFDSVVMDARNLTYNGHEQQTSLVVNLYDAIGNKTTLREGIDYEIDKDHSVLKGTNAGTYDITIIGKGKYEGAEKKTSWVIKKADVEIAITGLNATKEFNGKEQVFPGSGEKGFKAVETSATGLYKDESQISVASGHTIQAKGTDLGTYPLGINVAWLVFNDQQNVNAHFNLKADGSLTITEADISSVQASATSFVYNGAEQTTKITVKHNNVELAYGVDYEIDKNAVISATEVGRYQAKVKGIGNYKGVKNDIYWEITKANMTIKVTGNTLETEYTGYEQSVSGFKSEAVDGAVKLFDMDKVVICSGKPALAKGTDKGVYTTDINYSDTVKDLAYNDANINATFIGDKATSGVITQVKLTINAKKLQINAMDVKNYDGQPLVHSITTKDVDGAVSGQIVSGTVTTTSGEAGTYTDTKLDLTIKVDGKPDEGNLFYMLFGNGEDPRENYDIVNTSSLVITNDEQNYIIVKGNVESYEYNGESQSLGEKPYTVSTNIEDYDPSKLSITGDLNVTGTNAGDYYSSITKVTYDGQESANYTFTDAKLTITKRSINEAVLDKFTDTFYYNAKGQQPEAASIVAKDFEGAKTLASGTDYEYKAPQVENSINPGTYTITLDADAKANSNYKGKLDVNYMIFKASRTVHISGNKDSVAYDGNAHYITGYTLKEDVPAGESELINSAYVTPTYDDCVAGGTTIGNYPMGLSASEFAYVGADKDFINVQFVINQDGNLEIAAGDASSWTVTLDQTEFTYNGKAQGPNVVKVVDVNGNVIDPKFYDVTGNSEVNANVEGNYTLTVTAKGSYKGEKNVAWKINKASRVVEIYGEQSLDNVYNAKEISVYGYTATEVVGEGVESIVDLDKITPIKDNVSVTGKNVGTYKRNLTANEFNYGDANNVNVEFQIKQDVILKISRCDISTLSWTMVPEYKVYDGTVQNAPTVTLKNGDETLKPDEQYTVGGNTTGKEVAEYTLNINAINTSNYMGTLNLTWHIVPAVVDLYVEGNQVTKVYDRHEATASGFTVVKPDYISNTDILFDQDGDTAPSVSRTDAGVSSYGLEAESFTCVNPNVNATFHIQKDISVTISRKNIADNDILSTETHQDFTYSGVLYTSKITLKYLGVDLVEGFDNEFVVTNNTGVNAGNYSAKVEGVGNYEGFVSIDWIIHKLKATVTVNGAEATFEYQEGVTHSVMGYSLEVTTEDPERQEDANNIINTNLISPGKGKFELSSGEKGLHTLSLEEAYGGEIPWTYDLNNNDNVDLTFLTGSPLKLTITDTDIRNHPMDVSYTREFTYNGQTQSPQDSLVVKIQNDDKTWTTLTTSDYNFIGTGYKDVTPNVNYSFSIQGKGNYAGQLDNYLWKIVPKPITYTKTLESKTFDGSAISVNEEFADTGITGESFTATLKTKTINNGVVSDGVNAGTYYYPKEEDDTNYIDLSITPNEGTLASNYAVTVEPIEVDITSVELSKAEFNASSLVYNGNTQTPVITGKGVAGEVLNMDDFEYTITPQKNAGSYYVPINIKPEAISNYTGNTSVTWEITRASLPTFTYKDSKDYDGKTWGETATAVDFATGINNEKFSVTFDTDSANAGTYEYSDGTSGITEFTLTDGTALQDNYDVVNLTKSIEIIIKAKPIDPDVDPDIDIYVDQPENLIYNAINQKPTIVVKDGGSVVGASNYTITYSAESTINAGEYGFTVTGKENYTGTYTGIWSILPAPVTYNYEPEPHTYNGSQFTSSTTLTASTLSGMIFGSDSFELSFETLENELAAANVGEYNYPGQTGQKRASMSLTPTGSSLLSNYTFNITAKLVIKTTVISSLYKVLHTESLEYNGMDQMPEIKVVLQDDEGVELSTNEYTIVGDKHKDAGNGFGFYIQAKEGGNFTGTIGTEANPLTWNITQKSINYVFTDNVAYTGNNYSKEVKLSNTDGLCLSDTVNVSFMTYLNNVATGNAGEYELNAEITGPSLRATYNDGNYAINFEGSKVTIKGKSIDPEINSSISVNYTKRLEYVATEIAPNDLVIKDGETTLVPGTDYTTNLDSAKQLDVPESGGYTFTITGTGNYSGSFDNSWTIYPKTVEVPEDESSFIYNGEAQTKSYTVKAPLLLGSDEISLLFTTLGSNAGTYKYSSLSGDKQMLLEKSCSGGSENVVRDYELTIKGMTIKINPRAIGTYKVSGVEDRVYNAQTQTLDLTITDDTLPLQESDYKVVGVISAKDVQDPKVTLGKYEFHIVADSPNFTGEIWADSPNVPFKWAITPKAASYAFSAADFTYNARPYVSTGLEINHTTCSDVIDGDKIGLTVTSSGKDVGTYSFTTENAGTLSAQYSEITTLPRNYTITMSGSLNIIQKSLNAYDPDVTNPEYNGEDQSPTIVIVDKDTNETVSASEITWSGDTSAIDVASTDRYINATINGNYTGTIDNIPWNIRPKAITIKIAEEKIYDGQTIKVEGQWPGVKEEYFDYEYETTGSEVGTYTLENETITGGYTVGEGALETNYSVTEDVSMVINAAPSPDNPEYVPGQTGDSTPIAGFALMALTLIGAFLVLRRKRA